MSQHSVKLHSSRLADKRRFSVIFLSLGQWMVWDGLHQRRDVTVLSSLRVCCKLQSYKNIECGTSNTMHVCWQLTSGWNVIWFLKLDIIALYVAGLEDKHLLFIYVWKGHLISFRSSQRFFCMCQDMTLLIQIPMQILITTSTHWLCVLSPPQERERKIWDGMGGPRASHILSLVIRTTIGV